eukprot:5071636-Prymnesium_polylepis.1
MRVQSDRVRRSIVEQPLSQCCSAATRWLNAGQTTSATTIVFHPCTRAGSIARCTILSNAACWALSTRLERSQMLCFRRSPRRNASPRRRMRREAGAPADISPGRETRSEGGRNGHCSHPTHDFYGHLTAAISLAIVTGEAEAIVSCVSTALAGGEH